MLPDDGHVDVGAVATAQRRRQTVAQPPCLVGALAHLTEQVLPCACGDSAVVPVGAGIFAPLVEVLHVLALERLDLALDELIDLIQYTRKVIRQREIHSALLFQYPYSVFFQIVDNVAMASASVICSRSEAAKTAVKFSNSSAIAAAMCWGFSSRP